MLVALAIGSMLMLAVFDVVRVVVNGVVQHPLALGAIDEARSVSIAFVNEIRDATYGADGSYPLGQASTTQIIFFSPYNESSGSADRIRYFFASSTLYKGVTTPSGTAYILAQEKVTPVLHAVMSTTTPIFTYYDGTYNGGTTTLPLVQPVNVTRVTFAQLSVSVLSQDRRNATSTFIITTGSSIRNLKTNLGN